MRDNEFESYGQLVKNRNLANTSGSAPPALVRNCMGVVLSTAASSNMRFEVLGFEVLGFEVLGDV